MSAVLRGFVDSLKGTVVLFYLDIDIRERKAQQSPVRDKNVPPVRRQERESRTSIKKEEEPRVLKRTLQCCMLNGGVFWCSILIFDYGLLPFLKYLLTIVFGHSEIKQSVWSWMKLFLSCTFGALWVLPLFVLSRIVNSLWFQDIADSAYRHRRGRPQLLPGVSKLIANMLFSVMVQALFLVQVKYTIGASSVHGVKRSTPKVTQNGTRIARLHLRQKTTQHHQLWLIVAVGGPAAVISLAILAVHCRNSANSMSASVGSVPLNSEILSTQNAKHRTITTITVWNDIKGEGTPV